MAKFIAFTFLMLGIAFYELSGGADFEPELRAPIEIAETELAPVAAPAPAPQVSRADTSSLIQIAAPAQATIVEPTPEPIVAEPASFSGPLPAGEVIITPAPNAAAQEAVSAALEPTVEVTIRDYRAVAGEWVNMRSGPSTDYRVLETLPRGTEAEVLEVDNTGWARIRLTTTGQEGWMAERLLTDS